MGSSVVVTAAGGGVPLDELKELAGEWYAQRHRWGNRLTPWPEILRRLRRKGPEPWLLVDTADATAGGSPGHSAEALRRLLPAARRACPARCCSGWSTRAPSPRPGAGRPASPPATRRSPGKGALPGRERGTTRRAGEPTRVQAFSMGEAAVVESGQIQLVACSLPAMTPDPAFYECAGLRPDGALAVMAKSMTGWMAGLRRRLGARHAVRRAPGPAPWTSPPSRSREAAAGSGR